jgi:hypothetical protein
LVEEEEERRVTRRENRETIKQNNYILLLSPYIYCVFRRPSLHKNELSPDEWATGWIIGGSSHGSGWEFFSSPALGPTQPPIQWVQGSLSLGAKRPGREAEHFTSI